MAGSFSGFSPILKKKVLRYSKSVAAKTLTETLKKFEEAGVLYHNAAALFQDLSSKIRAVSVRKEPKPLNYFQAIMIVDQELAKEQPDKKLITRTISRCKKQGYINLMIHLGNLKRRCHLKEYFAIVGSLLRQRKTAHIVSELIDPLDPMNVINDPVKVRELLVKKYSLLFQSDLEKAPLTLTAIDLVNVDDITRVVRTIKKGKGIACDAIPDSVLDTCLFQMPMKLTQFVNECLSKGSIPRPHNISRLHLLNKLKGGMPSLDDLRPIMISSPVVKVIEGLALEDLKPHLEGRISKSQVGFISELNTNIHILRLVGRLMDLKRSRRAYGQWHVLFIDFRSAFDKVSHDILMEKLEKSGLKQNTLSTIKLLYNSYEFSVRESDPLKIRSGVAQGSLISPLLFDLYIDDLIKQLSDEFGTDNIYAYADDISILCRGIANVRRAIELIDHWAMLNHAEINKKKSGVLTLKGRDTKTSGSIRGIPIVQEYRYLGVRLDQSLTLKKLRASLKKKTDLFKRYVQVIHTPTLGVRTRLTLWKIYLKSLFDYYGPVIALCDRVKTFKSLYMSSLKTAGKALQSTADERVLEVLKIKSLSQIAYQHMKATTGKIKERFGKLPDSVSLSLDSLKKEISGYSDLQESDPDSAFYVDPETPNIIYTDFLRLIPVYGKTLVGLVMGNILNLRNQTGKLISCRICGQPASQLHFLNFCPLVSEERQTLLSLVPIESLINYRLVPDLYGLFYNLSNFALRLDSFRLGKSESDSPLAVAELLVTPLTTHLIQLSDSLLVKVLDVHKVDITNLLEE